MSPLRTYRKSLNPRRVAVAKAMAKLQAIEPDAKKLKENFAEIFEKAITQKTVEVFAPKGSNEQ